MDGCPIAIFPPEPSRCSSRTSRALRSLAERLGDRWPDLLAEHNRLLRTAFSAHGGTELGTEGDAFFVAFTAAGSAAAAAAEAQRALASHAWPDEEVIRVRMGLHTGEPTPTADGYVGLDMHRAARVTAAAHGGQVLLSQTTRDLLPENLDGLTFRDLGDHRLKDLTGPQRLHQLCIEGLAVDFPPPRTIEGRVTNLPAQPTPLVGREAELEAVRTLLLDENTRMVTLTGPGGTGKTRLALQVAADLVGEFPDGVYGVLLAPISDPDLVPLELARVLGVEESSSLSLVEALKAELRNRRVLIVFDNFEHVGAAAEVLAVLLGACQRLKMLVTSREPLRIAAERQYPVPPLARLRGCAPLRRARPRRAAGLRAGRRDAPVVAEICERLDGLPLAIELAAAWTKVLPPASLLRRLENRLELPAARGREVPARQSTLRQAIAWSYDLLGRRGAPPPSPPVGVHGRIHPRGGRARRRCEASSTCWKASPRWSTAACSARPKKPAASRGSRCSRRSASSRASSSRKRARRIELLSRHALEFARFAEEADAGLRGDDQLLWFERLEAEHDNLRAALDSSLAAGDDETALRLGGALGWFWYAHGHALEGCNRLTELLAATEGAPEELRARPMYALGVLVDQRGEPERAAELVERSLAIFREQGDRERVGAALNSLGSIKRALGDLDAARSLLEEGLAIRRELGDEARAASSLGNLGILAFERGDLDDAESRFLEALELDRMHGNEWGACAGLDSLVAVAIERGDHERARELNREMLASAQRVRRSGADRLRAREGRDSRRSREPGGSGGPARRSRGRRARSGWDRPQRLRSRMARSSPRPGRRRRVRDLSRRGEGDRARRSASRSSGGLR